MPLTKIEETNRGGLWGLWNIKESVSDLYGNLNPEGPDLERYHQKQNDKTKREFLASRLLVSLLLKEVNLNYQGVTRDDNNKPHLVGTEYKLSISHSDNYAAALIDPVKPAGIDIQIVQDKIMNLGGRIFSPEELSDAGDDVVKSTVYWSAKEVLYKIQGRKGINFVDHLKIAPFELNRHGHIGASICKEEVACDVELEFKLYDNFVVVYSV